MAGQLFYEDVEIGMEVPALVKNPTTRQLVKWAGGSGDYVEIHYDQEIARSMGLADIIVHGRLKAAFLVQMITDWIGELGTVQKFGVRYRDMDLARLEIVCEGKVTAKYDKGEQHYIECDVWTKNTKGQQTTTGSITFTLPTRS